MFRMLRLQPPHGWNAVAWELGIVTLGVLVALAAQQWVEERSWRDKAQAGKAAVRQELALHYAWSVEWRVIQPCVSAQIEGLQARVMASGDRLNPAPIHSEDGLPRFVIRMPSKDYESSVWQSLIGDGVTSYLDPALRSELSAHYSQAATMIGLTARNESDYQRLSSLSRPLLLDPTVRFSLVQSLEELRGRVEFMDLQSGQLIDHIQKVGMIPDRANARREVERFGTYRFCKAQRLPMRSFDEAMRAVPN